MKSLVSLRLENHPSLSRSAQKSGFFRRLFDAEGGYSLALEQANTDLVLFLYAQLTGRTLLRSPHLPTPSFSLNATGPDQVQIARRLERALAKKGITAIQDGERFLLIVPTSDAARIRPRSMEIKSFANYDGRPELFPGGAIINFPNAELSQVLALYADLTGRMLNQQAHAA